MQSHPVHEEGAKFWLSISCQCTRWYLPSVYSISILVSCTHSHISMNRGIAMHVVDQGGLADASLTPKALKMKSLSMRKRRHLVNKLFLPHRHTRRALKYSSQKVSTSTRQIKSPSPKAQPFLAPR